jgi:hypothetical protein
MRHPLTLRRAFVGLAFTVEVIPRSVDSGRPDDHEAVRQSHRADRVRQSRHGHAAADGTRALSTTARSNFNHRYVKMSYRICAECRTWERRAAPRVIEGTVAVLLLLPCSAAATATGYRDFSYRNALGGGHETMGSLPATIETYAPGDCGHRGRGRPVAGHHGRLGRLIWLCSLARPRLPGGWPALGAGSRLMHITGFADARRSLRQCGRRRDERGPCRHR